MLPVIFHWGIWSRWNRLRFSTFCLLFLGYIFVFIQWFIQFLVLFLVRGWHSAGKINKTLIWYKQKASNYHFFRHLLVQLYPRWTALLTWFVLRFLLWAFFFEWIVLGLANIGGEIWDTTSSSVGVSLKTTLAIFPAITHPFNVDLLSM